MQLISVRTNHEFFFDPPSKKLVAMTELIILAEKPAYELEGSDIIRKSKVEEIRFKCSSEAITLLLQQLTDAAKNALHFEKVAEAMNEILSDTDKTVPTGTPVNKEPETRGDNEIQGPDPKEDELPIG